MYDLLMGDIDLGLINLSINNGIRSYILVTYLNSESFWL